jgi:hypothetical protein
MWNKWNVNTKSTYSQITTHWDWQMADPTSRRDGAIGGGRGKGYALRYRNWTSPELSTLQQRNRYAVILHLLWISSLVYFLSLYHNRLQLSPSTLAKSPGTQLLRAGADLNASEKRKVSLLSRLELIMHVFSRIDATNFRIICRCNILHLPRFFQCQKQWSHSRNMRTSQ